MKAIVRHHWVAVLWFVCAGRVSPLAAEDLLRYRQSQPHMGTQFTLTVYAASQEQADRALAAAFTQIGELDACLSNYRPESEVNQLSHAAPHAAPVPVTAHVWQMLQRSEQYSRLSEGAFDITVGPVTKLWRKARRTHELPDETQLQQARDAVGYGWLRLDTAHQTAQMLRPGMLLDLGGIAKGYALDVAMQTLHQHGVTCALLDGGGGLLAGAPPPGKDAWSVGIADLNGHADESTSIPFANRGVATSGDLFQFVEIGGTRYSHIVNPHTGIGLTRRCAATVLAADATAADALATAVCVLGPEQGLQLIQSLPDTEALVRVMEGEQVHTYRTDGFPLPLPASSQ